ncbi:MAG: TRAP transporter substrate-binding protein [Alphaproteobacteria bacterium]|nr:TRAP transporter substrate-binding protein [Alphaproteobacteria bacterium]
MDRRSFLKTPGSALVQLLQPPRSPHRPLRRSTTDMVIVSTWPRDFPGLGTSAQRLAARIGELTEGRINVQYFAAGERVGAFDSFDEVASGNAQAYIGADYYWKGKHPAWAYFTAVPFGLTYAEIDAWIKYGGGQELWDELAGEFGVKNFAAGNTGVQMGGWFNKEIKSLEDYKGLKMRIPGLGGEVVAAAGATVVNLPGGEIPPALAGAVDATEWVGPWNDYFMKFYEAAKYYYYPGMHDPGSQLAMGMNKAWYDGLSKTDQAIIEAVCNEENARQMAESNANNGIYLDKLINEHGVELKRFNDEVYDAFGEAAAEVFEETREHSDLAARTHDSFAKARSEIGRWMLLADTGYTVQRNRVLGISI